MNVQNLSKKKTVDNCSAQVEFLPDSESNNSEDHKPSFSRYQHALKTFIPIRSFSKTHHPNDSAGLFSILTFSWLTGLVWKTFKKPPSIDDLWKISEYDETRRNYKRLSRIWKNEVREKGIKNASLHKVIWKFVCTRILLSSMCIMAFGAAIFVNSSYIIQQLLMYVSSNADSTRVGLVLIVSLVSVEITRACMLSSYFLLNYRTAIRARSAILLLIFKKIMKMSSASKQTAIGELITMCSNDGDRVFEVMRGGNAILLAPLLFIAGTIYNCYMLGPVSLLGSFIFILVIPFQGILIKVMNKLRLTSIQQGEIRINKINEVLSSIKMVKMYGWEDSFTKVINEIREVELSALKKAGFLQSINVSLAFLSPIFASVLMFCAFVLLNNPLTPELAFTAIALYNVMANSLKFMPIAIKSIAEVTVSLNRFKEVLSLNSLQEYVKDYTKDKKNVIEIENASFAWDSSIKTYNTELFVDQTSNLILDKGVGSNLVLKNVNLNVESGSLIGIFGAVGSGKTSLIAGVLGQLSLCEGSVAVCGSVAYCSQQAWLMNTTIQENILFGSAYDAEKYQDIVSSCELQKDFEVFQSGDLTEVGERGINLSGGQKQRISIARALYSDKSIYILDDPLSALDAHVGKSIFVEVILKRLKNAGKTILLVTHQTQYLTCCDQIIQVKNSVVTSMKSMDESIKSTQVLVNSKSDGAVAAEKENIESEIKNPKELENDLDSLMQGKLMTVEESGNNVLPSTYHRYIQASGGYFPAVLMLIFFLVNVSTQQFSNLWLSIWLKPSQNLNLPDLNSSLVTNQSVESAFTYSNDILQLSNVHYFLMIYGLSAVVMLIVSVIRGYAFVSMTIQASKELHNKLFQVVLHGTMEFFDTTPMGRILNRFQKDADEQDVMLPYLLEMFLLNSSGVIIAILIISFVFRIFLIVVVIIFIVFLIVYIIFKPSVREMRRLDVLTRSPWFSHITTALSGLDTIRTYQRTNDFIDIFCDLLDQNGVPYYLFACVNRWLALRLDALTIVASAFISIVVVVVDISPAFAGLALSSMFLINGMLQFTTRLLIETEARFVCVDRIQYYINNTPQESVQSSATVGRGWPQNGKIEFCNVSLRYRKGMPLVLKNLSFCFNAGEKIGVVGRTGSGKSSLAVAMFRLVGLAEGKILLDDVDISKLSFQALRSSMSIIPQDPALFSGTVRYNLDPFNMYNDNDIWIVLKQVHLENRILSSSGQLNAEVSENGTNFSVGERQLLCLARALLRKSKILFLDEATAAIDRETESIVQDVIDVVFSSSTVVTIAHRLATVANSDRVLVLDEGNIIEFDRPQVLLHDTDSAFHKMNHSFQDHVG